MICKFVLEPEVKRSVLSSDMGYLSDIETSVPLMGKLDKRSIVSEDTNIFSISQFFLWGIESFILEFITDDKDLIENDYSIRLFNDESGEELLSISAECKGKKYNNIIPGTVTLNYWIDNNDDGSYLERMRTELSNYENSNLKIRMEFS